MTVLVCAAHPDDETIGLGATIAKIAKEEEVISVIFSYGEKFPPWIKKDILIKKRIEEALNAGKILGIKKTYFLGEKDLEFHPSIKTLSEIMRKHKPNKIFYHSNFDIHPDHLAVNRAVEKVLKLNGDLKPEIYNFEVNLIKFRYSSPYIIFDVSDTFHLKMKALNEFKTQKIIVGLLKPFLLLKAKYFGMKFGYKYAECFTSK